MADELQDYEQPSGRPMFITVLCILTFVGSGWGLIGGAMQYFGAARQSQEAIAKRDKMIVNMHKDGRDDKGSRFAEKITASMSSAFTEENLKKSGLTGILSAIFCLTGAGLMWKLNKKGYYTYIVGIIIGIVAPFLIFGSSNFLSIMSSVVVGFIGVVFVILYGVNLKYMR